MYPLQCNLKRVHGVDAKSGVLVLMARYMLGSTTNVPTYTKVDSITYGLMK